MDTREKDPVKGLFMIYTSCFLRFGIITSIVPRTPSPRPPTPKRAARPELKTEPAAEHAACGPGRETDGRFTAGGDDHGKSGGGPRSAFRAARTQENPRGKHPGALEQAGPVRIRRLTEDRNRHHPFRRETEVTVSCFGAPAAGQPSERKGRSG